MTFEARPLIIGHRGAAGLQPENTLPSFRAAVELGVDAVELDIHRCADRLCVIHDAKLERTTNGHGQVSETPLAELRTLDAGGGAPVPFLEEVLDALPDSVGVNIELKGSGTAEPLARLLVTSAPPHVLVSSFNHPRLREFRQHAPEIPVAALFDRWQDRALDIAAELNSRFVNLSKRILTRQRCEQVLERGYLPLVYTVNSTADAAKFFDMGVTGVFTDYPDRLRRAFPAARTPV